MTKLDNIKDVKVGEQEIEIDPRSKTTADRAYNYIGTGGPEIEVQVKGTKRMLKNKSKTARWI